MKRPSQSPAAIRKRIYRAKRSKEKVEQQNRNNKLSMQKIRENEDEKNENNGMSQTKSTAAKEGRWRMKKKEDNEMN